MTVFVHADMAAVAEILHGPADAGLGKSQLIGDIDGTDIWLIQTEDLDGLQIIFSAAESAAAFRASAWRKDRIRSG